MIVQGSSQHSTARVLCIINSLGGGGAERSLLDLLPYCLESGIEPVITCFRLPKNGVDGDISALGIDLHDCSGGGAIEWCKHLRRLLRTERFDLVHTTLFESDIVGRVAAAGSRVPVLTSLVNTTYEKIRLTDPNIRRVSLLAARLLDGWTCRNLTTHFHAITHAVKDASVSALGIDPQKITVIERGRDPLLLGDKTAERRCAIRSKLGFRKDEVLVVTVGRQEFQKGHKYLLSGFLQVANAHPRSRLLLVGGAGHVTAELELLQEKLGLADRIRFLGYRDDVPDILAAADLFVFPSLYEGQGGALLEAMGLGLPIVATDIPSTREVCEDGRNALLVPVGSSTSLGEAMCHLISDPAKMEAFGRRSIEIFRTRFTLERSASGMIRLYQALIRGNDAAQL